MMKRQRSVMMKRQRSVMMKRQECDDEETEEWDDEETQECDYSLLFLSKKFSVPLPNQICHRIDMYFYNNLFITAVALHDAIR